mmetsp:Transcript_8386/g.10316  ORF Transcript_8386/g.10316 Transcript_8386/m.10316 type:complete len:102 (-) Transcript_8386:331-636(-)
MVLHRMLATETLSGTRTPILSPQKTWKLCLSAGALTYTGWDTQKFLLMTLPLQVTFPLYKEHLYACEQALLGQTYTKTTFNVSMKTIESLRCFMSRCRDER